MNNKFCRLLSLVLCISMLASNLVFAMPDDKVTPLVETSSYVGTPSNALPDESDIQNAEPEVTPVIPPYIQFPDKADINDTQLETSQVATPSFVNRSEEQKTFTDYFLDPNFAQVVAEILGKNKNDMVTAEQLSAIPSLSTYDHTIMSIEGIENLTQLKYLSLDTNQITELPEPIGQLTNLQYLSLKGTSIAELPETIGQLSNLQYLTLSKNQITELPVTIGQLTSLQYLYLNGNQITELPETIGQLTSLRYLTLSNNQLIALPETIGQLTNLQDLYLSGNQITELPVAIGQLTNLQHLYLYNNLIISPIPDSLFAIDNLILDRQYGILPTYDFIDAADITDEQITSPLIMQTKDNNNGILAGIWSIEKPDGSTISIASQNGSEINPSLFNEPGNYTVSFQWTSEEPYTGFTMNGSLDFNSKIEITVGRITEQSHQVTLITRYSDDALTEHSVTYQVPHGAAFLESFDVLDNYGLVSTELYQIPDFVVDIDTKTVSLDPVEKDYTIVLVFEKRKPSENQHNVTVITRYLDNALPEHTASYQVEHGSSFRASFEVLDGYDLYNAGYRSQPLFDADIDTKTVSLDVVEKDYVIELEFDKATYKVKLTTSYLDNSLPDLTRTDRIRYQEIYQQTYQIAEGYQVVNADQLPADVLLDETNNTVTINRIMEDREIFLQLEKKLFDVTIMIIYEDGSRENQVTTYQVPYGENFETGFEIDEDYVIKKIQINATGAFVNRSDQTITVNQVIDPVTVTITVR